MERYRTMRAYSAGGVVFRLVPQRSEAGQPQGSQPSSTPSPSLQDGNNSEGQSRDESGSHDTLGYLPPRQGSYSQDGSIDGAGGSIEVALVGRSHSGIWALPKGTPQPGETIEQVAVREVQEETGLQVRLISYIGSITYTFVRGQVRYHKQVRHFLMEAIGGDIALHDQEYDRVEWFPISEACRRLTYQNEVNILYQAEEILQRWLQYRQKEGHN